MHISKKLCSMKSIGVAAGRWYLLSALTPLLTISAVTFNVVQLTPHIRASALGSIQKMPIDLNVSYNEQSLIDLMKNNARLQAIDDNTPLTSDVEGILQALDTPLPSASAGTEITPTGASTLNPATDKHGNQF